MITIHFWPSAFALFYSATNKRFENKSWPDGFQWVSRTNSSKLPLDNIIATDRGTSKGLQCQYDARNQGVLYYYLSTSPTLECLSDAHHQGLQCMSDDTILKQLPHYVVLNWRRVTKDWQVASKFVTRKTGRYRQGCLKIVFNGGIFLSPVPRVHLCLLGDQTFCLTNLTPIFIQITDTRLSTITWWEDGRTNTPPSWLITKTPC
jgi:hypothetical protein